jgi:predicted Zn-dependent protease with MMP-like domain
MTKQDFARLVEEAVGSIPDGFRNRFANLSFVVQQMPPPDISRKLARHPMGLLGTYQGIPYPRRGPWYGNVTPDRIVIYQQPIEAQCSSEDEIRHLVQKVVIHEVGHYFGLSDPELRRLEAQTHGNREEGR